MRQYHKTQCLETIKVLYEAQAEINKYIEKRQADNAMLLLEQCQQGAISIGAMVENTEGEGTEAVRCLEEYCELIYFMPPSSFVRSVRVSV